jgi:putative ABC transport system ATP-binding protein
MGLNCNLEHELYKPVSSLSGGQRQMLATLMAMNSDKPILVLDEHTSALDISMQKRLMAYSANQIIERELTTVMITHKFDEALTFGNRLVIMSHGKIVCDLNRDDKKELNRKKLMDLVYGVAEMGACHGC